MKSCILIGVAFAINPLLGIMAIFYTFFKGIGEDEGY